MLSITVKKITWLFLFIFASFLGIKKKKVSLIAFSIFSYIKDQFEEGILFSGQN